MFVNTPERAGVGECDRCHTQKVERVRYQRRLEVPDPWGEDGVTRTVVLVEPVCEPCYEAQIAIDNT